MSSVEFVDAATARDAGGLRLIVAKGLPSPWSMAARALLEFKQIPILVVRAIGRDESVEDWIGKRSWNVPIAIYERELPRAGWAEILELAERLRPEPRLLPRAPDLRVAHYGLSHVLMGESGVLWNARLLAIDAGLRTGGQAGFRLPVAQYLASRYGEHAAEDARTRLVEGLELVARHVKAARAEGHRYVFGEQLTALDIYVAHALTMLAPLPLEQCPDHPARAAFAWVHEQLGGAIPRVLLQHRDDILKHDLGLPIAF